MTAIELILDVADRAIECPNHYLIPGHNGPYNHPETDVRNIGHWLIILGKAYKWTERTAFKNRVSELAEYLCSKDARPYGFSFHHRNKEGKDSCNGLIGQAWTFEALVEAASILGDDKYLALAEEVFFQHHFNEEHALWQCLEIDGNDLPVDPTFNHQLWFAASASLLKSKRETEVRERVVRFLDYLPENLTILDNGLIYHPVEHLWETQFERNYTLKAGLKKRIRNILRYIKSGKWPEKKPAKNKVWQDARNKMVNKSVGYHAFNMYAFALLKQQIPEHPFWETGEFKMAVDYMLTDEYKEGLNENKYGYPYNPPGFEIPFSLYVLKDMSKEELLHICRWWAGEQFRKCWNTETGMMDKNTEDPLTLTSRMYEATRLPQEILDKILIPQ